MKIYAYFVAWFVPATGRIGSMHCTVDEPIVTGARYATLLDNIRDTSQADHIVVTALTPLGEVDA